jgi:hypothetical protein
MKYSLRSLMIAVTLVCVGLGIHLAFRSNSDSNYQLWLGWYLVAASLLSAVCISKDIGLRGAYLATAIFGWAYLVFVLKAGFGIESMSQAYELAISTRMGLAFMVVCFLIAAAGNTLVRSTLGNKP